MVLYLQWGQLGGKPQKTPSDLDMWPTLYQKQHMCVNVKYQYAVAYIAKYIINYYIYYQFGMSAF